MANKPRICLFPHLGYLSETSRMVAVYKALVAAGEEPIMASHGGTYDWVLEQEGIPWQRVEPEMSIERCKAFVKANRIDGAMAGFYQEEELEEIVDDIMHEAHSIADLRNGFVETSIYEEATDKSW